LHFLTALFLPIFAHFSIFLLQCGVRGTKKIHMKITLFTLGALLCVMGVNGQSFTMMNGSASIFNGYFYDGGENPRDYKPNENLINTETNLLGQAELTVEFMVLALGDGNRISAYKIAVDFERSLLAKTK